MKANDRTIGTLVDADIEEESTKLKALQTQQQLAVQALSIANSGSQDRPVPVPLRRKAGPALAGGPNRTRKTAALTSSAAFFSSADFERVLQPTKV